MRIMFAVPSYWPSQNGVAYITEYLAEGLAERGHEILVFTSTGNGGLEELPKYEVHRKVRIERIRVYVRWPLKLKGRDKESTKKKYYDRIVTFQPDILIVVCAQSWTFDWLKPYLERIKCIKVFYSHGYSEWKDKYPLAEKIKTGNILGVVEEWLKERYYKQIKYIIKKYDLAIYLSEQNNSCLYAQQNHLKNGMILENAIENRFFDKDMQREGKEKKAEAKIQFLYIANYNDNKNQSMLLEAYNRADIDESRLVFAGFEENEYLNSLRNRQKLFDNQERKEVVFKVHLSREEIYDLYRDSDVFVCASRAETWSIVAHEAAAAGLPIISTDVGIISRIDGVLLVNSVEEMKKAIELLYWQADERLNRGRRARAWIETRNCRIEDKVKIFEDKLEQMCAGD